MILGLLKKKEMYLDFTMLKCSYLLYPNRNEPRDLGIIQELDFYAAQVVGDTPSRDWFK